VRSQTELTADEQAGLERLCAMQLTSGDPASPDALSVRRLICLTIIRDSGVRGPTAAAARQACDESGQIPPSPLPLQGATSPT
jgi:hypothetical protein